MSNTIDILSRFKDAYEKGKANENYDLPKDVSASDIDMDEYRKELERLRKMEGVAIEEAKSAREKMMAASKDDEREPEDKRDFEIVTEEERKLPEKTMEAELETIDVPCEIKVRRAYCPECGSEIVSDKPVMFNPWTGESVSPYKCSCGHMMNLQYSYPRIVVTDINDEEIKCWIV